MRERRQLRRVQGRRSPRAIPRNRWGVSARDLQLPPGTFYNDDGCTDPVATVDQVPTRLARAGHQMGEVWLWCLHCERFFQAKHLKRDFLGNWQQCPFDDCGAAGFDVDILVWDWRRELDPAWPQSDAELVYGQSLSSPGEQPN